MVGVFQASMRGSVSYSVADSLPVNIMDFNSLSDSDFGSGDILSLVINGIGTAWGILVSFLMMGITLFTFTIQNPCGVPSGLVWILWIMVIPVYIIAMVGLIPFVIELVKSILAYLKIL